MRWIGLSLAGVVLLATPARAGTAGVVLAVSPFRNLDYGSQMLEHEVVGARDRVVAQLVRQYDCFVCNRTRGFDTAVEQSRGELASIEKAAVDAPAVRQADYVVSAFFRMNEGQLECVVLYSDLSKGTNATPVQIAFLADSLSQAVDQVPGKVAQALSLRARPEARESLDGQTQTQTWVVLPFVVADRKSTRQSGRRDASVFKERTLESDFAIRAELALQKSGLIGRLVDHASLASVLEETKVAMVSGRSDDYADAIARLVGADRVVLGSVGKCAGAYWLSLFILDAKTATVLASVSKRFPSMADAQEGLSSLVPELVRLNGPAPGFVAADSVRRAQEAELYLFQADEGREPLRQVTPASCGEAVMANCEAAYLLAKDNPGMRYRIGAYLLSRIVRPNTPWRHLARGEGRRPRYSPDAQDSLWTSFAPGFSDVGRYRAAQLACDLMAAVDDSPATPGPLLHRARALILLGRIQEADAAVARHRKESPDSQRSSAILLQAKCAHEEGRDDEALRLVDEFHGMGEQTQESQELLRLVRAPSADKLSEYAAIKAETKRPLDDRLPELMPLMREIDGPQASLAYLASLPVTWRASPEYRLELARTCLAAGDRDGAILASKSLLEWDDLRDRLPPAEDFTGNWKADERERTDAARAVLAAATADDGAVVADPFKLPRDVRTLRPDQKLYLLPSDRTSEMLLGKIAAVAGKALGLPVEVLPQAPLDTNTVDRMSEQIKYRSIPLAESMLRASSIPEDAVCVVCVTAEYLTPTQTNDYTPWNRSAAFAISDATEDAAITTYRQWQSALPKCPGDDYVVDQTAKAVVGIFLAKVSPVCSNYPCVRWRAPPRGASVNKTPIKRQYYSRFAACPVCQDFYRRADVDGMQRRFQSYIRSLHMGLAAGDDRRPSLDPARRNR